MDFPPTHSQLVDRVRSHWRLFHPKLYAEYEKDGELDQKVEETATEIEEYAKLLHERQGFRLHEAWSIAERELLLENY